MTNVEDCKIADVYTFLCTSNSKREPKAVIPMEGICIFMLNLQDAQISKLAPSKACYLTQSSEFVGLHNGPQQYDTKQIFKFISLFLLVPRKPNTPHKMHLVTLLRYVEKVKNATKWMLR